MSRPPFQVRRISSVVWCLEAPNSDIPRIIIAVAPGRAQFSIEKFDVVDPDLPEANTDNIKEVLVQSLRDLANKIQAL